MKKRWEVSHSQGPRSGKDPGSREVKNLGQIIREHIAENARHASVVDFRMGGL